MSRKIFNGALIVVAMRWTDRLVGLISTLILARLLVPDDFGVIAMASLFTGLIDVLLDLGVVTMLIHKRRCDYDDYSTAWTIRLIQASLAASIIIISSPWVADYFNDPRVTAVLWVMSAGVIMGGLENIGIVSFQKEMNFRRDFQFFFLRRVVGFTATVGLAWTLKSYWALPFGALIGRSAGVGFSYLIHPLRPRLTLTRFKSMWSLSQWILIRSIGSYTDSRLDKLLIGHRADAATIGAYSLADEISAMPSTELLAPLGRVLFPAFVEVRDKPEELRRTFLLALAVQTMIALPAATGLTMVAREAIPVLLGERWISAIPFVQVLSLIYGISSVSHAAGYMLLTLGKMRTMAIFVWTQVAIFAIGALTFLSHHGALALAQWRLAVALFGACFFITLVIRSIDGLRTTHILLAIWRPIAATLSMATVLTFMPRPDHSALVMLLSRCATGAVVYSVTLLALWVLVGRPPGSEAYLLGKLHIYNGEPKSL